MRSAFTIFVLPTRAHSARICRTVASFATIVTRPLRSDSCTSARTAGAAASQATTASAMVEIENRMLTFPRSIDLLLTEIVDDLREDIVESELGLVADHFRS